MESHEYPRHFDDIRQLQMAAELEADSQTADSIADYFNYLLEMYVDHPFIGGGMQHAARMVEPQDRLLGAAEGIPSAVSFYSGIIIGARVAEICGGTELLDSLSKASWPQPANRSDDVFEAAHNVAAVLVNRGDEMYQAASAYHPLIESWLDELVPDVTKQRYMKSGFGLMLHLIGGAERILANESLEDSLEHCDWDTEFRDLLSE